MYIFDHYYSSTELPQNRSFFGHLKFFEEKNPLYTFTQDADKECIYILSLDCYSPIHCLSHLKNNFLKNKNNFLIIDTTTEDFLEPHSKQILKDIEDFSNVDNTLLLTGYSPVSAFKKDFDIEYDCYNYNSHETMLYIWRDHSTIHDDWVKPTLPRQLKKHFTILNKNCRPQRKIFHALCTKENIIEKSYYSWHNEGLNEDWTIDGGSELINHLISLNLISNKSEVDNLMKPIYFDDIMSVDEWEIPFSCREHGGVYININTSFKADTPFDHGFLYDNINSFFTEKTFNPIINQIPSINVFSKQHFKEFKNMGYIPLDDIYFKDLDFTSTLTLLKTQLEMVKHIASLSLDELKSIEQSSEVQDILQHNLHQFNKQDCFNRLINFLNNR